jgi:hypothetical protein
MAVSRLLLLFLCLDLFYLSDFFCLHSSFSGLCTFFETYPEGFTGVAFAGHYFFSAGILDLYLNLRHLNDIDFSENKMDPLVMITLKQLILLIITGLIAGFVSGMLGVGGAIIIVPFLVFLLGMQQHEAQGTSLLVLVLPVGIFALINYAKSGYVNYKFALILVIMFVIGSYFGSKLAISLPAKALQKIFALLLLGVAIKILSGK